LAFPAPIVRGAVTAPIGCDLFALMSQHDFAALRRTSILDVAIALGHEVFRGGLIRCPVPEAHATDYTKPTMGLDRKINRAKCFACDASGSVLDLVVWSKRCSLTEAAAYLARFAQKAPPTAPRSKPLDLLGKSREATDEDLAVFRTFMDLCARVEAVPDIAAYVEQRLPPAWDMFARVGLRAIAKPEAVADRLQRLHPVEVLHQAGIMDETGHFRLGRHRLVQFMLKTDRRPYSFQARHLGDEHPRFLNPAGIKIPCLLAQVGLQGLRPRSEIYLTEGMFDTLTVCGVGPIALGLPGAGLANPDLLQVLTKYRVIYIPQNDEAGRASIKNVARELRWLKVLHLPEPGDVNDHLRRVGPESLFVFLKTWEEMQ